MSGVLYLIPTPIGHLKDITLRALECLAAVEVVLAEDTRTTGILLKHYSIAATLQPFHAHNEHQVLGKVLSRLESGAQLALVTDAGSPAISDPGFLLVRAAVEAGIRVESLPGATAFVPALTASGLPADRFCFEGFLPPKKGRQKRLLALAAEPRTIVLYESPHRLLRTLNDLCGSMGEERAACVCREISKIHETYHRGSLGDLHGYFSEVKPRGELVLVVAGKA